MTREQVGEMAFAVEYAAAESARGVSASRYVVVRDRTHMNRREMDGWLACIEFNELAGKRLGAAGALLRRLERRPDLIAALDGDGV